MATPHHLPNSIPFTLTSDLPHDLPVTVSLSAPTLDPFDEDSNRESPCSPRTVNLFVPASAPSTSARQYQRDARKEAVILN